MHDKCQDIVLELADSQNQGQYNTPADAIKLASDLATQVARDLGARTPTPTACVADASMEALLDSGATDHTVGIKALSSEQLKGRYKIPKQIYNMATGTIEVTEAVDLFVLALGVVLDFRLLPGRICKERGFRYLWDDHADSAVVTCPGGQVADTWYRGSFVCYL